MQVSPKRMFAPKLHMLACYTWQTEDAHGPICRYNELIIERSMQQQKARAQQAQMPSREGS